MLVTWKCAYKFIHLSETDSSLLLKVRKIYFTDVNEKSSDTSSREQLEYV